MLILDSVEYKNFMSVGNSPIKLKLNTGKVILIGGKNGSGKSTALNAVTYGLFGKLLNNMKLEQAINSINKKNLLVKVDFTVNGQSFQVIRGEKPKRFEIIREGELVEKDAKSKDYQAFLEVILGIDFKTFVQLFAINKTRFVPFMKMAAGDRRKIVEDVLGISVFRHMNEIVSKDMSELSKNITNLERERDLLIEKQNGVANLVKQLESSINDSTASTQNELDQAIENKEKLNEEREDLKKQLDLSCDELYAHVQNDVSALTKLGNDLERDLNYVTKQKKFFTDNAICPTCEQDISNDIKEHKCKEFDEQTLEIEHKFGDMAGELLGLNQKEEELKLSLKNNTEIKNKIRTLDVSIQHEQTSINSLTKKLEAMKKSSDAAALEKAVADYEELDKKIEEQKGAYIDLMKAQDLYNTMKTMLKDDGVKSNIIKDYNVLMNKSINEFLNDVGFYINLTIDENFNETFHSMNKESFSYENLSNGQQTRLDLSIMLALMLVGSIKNSSSCNVLWLDETLEAMDDISDMIRLFRSKLPGKTIFVTSQRYDEFLDKFDTSIYFKLNNDFTEIEKGV